MKKLGIATALALSLVFGAGSVLAKQNSNTSTGGGTTTGAKKHRKHRRHRRHHRRSTAKAANANANR